MSGLRRIAPFFAALALLGLFGCGENFDPFQIYQGGEMVDLVGVIHYPGTTRGDFTPRKLVATLTAPLDELDVQSLLESELPGSKLTYDTSNPSQAVIEIPEGMSLQAAAAALGDERRVADMLPEFAPGASAAATLRTTGTGFLHLQPVITRLTARDHSDLRGAASRWVVRIRARHPVGQNEVGPTAFLETLTVERLRPNTIVLKGGFERHGPSRECPLLRLDDGRLVELTGAEAVRMVSLVTPGAAAQVTAYPLSLSMAACSGGLQVEVLSFGPRQ